MACHSRSERPLNDLMRRSTWRGLCSRRHSCACHAAVALPDLAHVDVAEPRQRDERRRREMRQALDVVQRRAARVAAGHGDERALQRGRGQAQPVGKAAGRRRDTRCAREWIGAGLGRNHLRWTSRSRRVGRHVVIYRQGNWSVACPQNIHYF
jgi:hypothetical protein